ncbi:hypothetical protein VP1G_05900 [Cytospora mali]|uniref:Uncharacterized protein n=1 Tax=Cytospora mali TaxID=578113 RepID=A0A194V3V3_CYTMA|nr:hypothetical protein VP1G_05900 [Valsa mali var. pyri (nom. inval.)]
MRGPEKRVSKIHQLKSIVNAEQCRAFLGYVHEELGRLSQRPESYAIHNPEKLIDVVAEFSRTPDLSRDKAIAIVSSVAGATSLNSAVTAQASHCVSAELALKIWANLHVQFPRQSPVPMFTPVETVIPWTDNTTFQSLVRSQFEARMGRPATDLSRIDPKFSMDLFVKAYEYRVSWTSNLADHLKINPESPRLIMVYEHKICLWNHLKMAQDKNSVPVLPVPLIEEAIDTLNLLFPLGKKSTKSFLRRHGKSFHGLGKCGRATQYDLQKYHYWRKEIGDLAEVLSQRPRGKAQFILNRDGTNTLDFWTFWTAIAFGILTIIGVATGVYSAVYAKKALDVETLQYQLALAQACSAPNATDLLPGFCH